MEANISMLPTSLSLRKFNVLESSNEVMIVGSDKCEEEFHIIRFDKKTDMESCNVRLDEIIHEELQTFTKEELQSYMMEQSMRSAKGSSTNSLRFSFMKETKTSAAPKKDGNLAKSSVASSSAAHSIKFEENTKNACGILGLVKFLRGYYLIVITQKKKVAKIGHHNIYQVKDMKMIRLFKWVSSMRKEDENKYVDLFKQIKINEGFYFSYTYDLTHTLQYNILK